ncbi:MAG: hypothetical protein ACKO1H_18380 [Tabrizicola sp.]
MTFWVGVALGLVGLYATSTLYFMFLAPIGLPIVGGLLYFLKLASEHDAASEHALSMRQLAGQTAGVILALFLGVPVGIFFAMLLAAGG